MYNTVASTIVTACSMACQPTSLISYRGSKMLPLGLFSRKLNTRELKMETFSGRRQLKPDVTSWFVHYCACSCSSHCRRAPVGDVRLICLALWREREYLTLISIRSVAFSNQNFADYRSSLNCPCFLWVTFEARFPSYLNLYLYNVSMFNVTESRSNLIQYGKLQTVSQLYMDKIDLRAKWKYPGKKYELRYFNCVFLAHLFL